MIFARHPLPNPDRAVVKIWTNTCLPITKTPVFSAETASSYGLAPLRCWWLKAPTPAAALIVSVVLGHAPA